MKNPRDLVAKLCGWVSAAFLAAMLLLIVVDVVLRKFGLSPIHGTFELVELLLVCTFFFALPATFLREENIVVDMIDGWRPQWVPIRALRRGRVVLATIAWQSGWRRATRVFRRRHLHLRCRRSLLGAVCFGIAGGGRGG
jgi:hypothetical protein